MSEQIDWSVAFTAVLGPKVSESGRHKVGAYDKLSVSLEGNASDIDIEVQPSASAADVELLVIRASSYDPPVTYSADEGANEFELDGPLVLIGTGAVGLLAKPPQKLRFGNVDTDPVSVEILVGRQT
jgi:hypothetical protein